MHESKECKACGAEYGLVWNTYTASYECVACAPPHHNTEKRNDAAVKRDKVRKGDVNDRKREDQISVSINEVTIGNGNNKRTTVNLPIRNANDNWIKVKTVACVISAVCALVAWLNWDYITTTLSTIFGG